MSKTAFITGATGFLGQWITRRFLESGWRVAAFDRVLDFERPHPVFGPLPTKGITWMCGDIADPAGVERAVAQVAPNVIIHLAAALIPLCRAQPALAASVNVTGHINIFEAARLHRVPRVIYASSVASRSRGASGRLMSTYGTFKLWSEEYSASYFEQFGVSSIGLRPDIVYGPGRQAGETAFVNAAIADVASGRKHQISRRWSMRLEHVEEVADVFFRCATAQFEGAFGSDITADSTTECDLVSALKQAVEDCHVSCGSSAFCMTSPPAERTQILSIIGDWPHIPLAEGVRRTIAQIRSAPPPTT
jgi:UDP-glucuronate 4-epimerase